VHHPDLFLASAICIMHDRGQDITIGGFEACGVPAIYDELFGEDE